MTQGRTVLYDVPIDEASNILAEYRRAVSLYPRFVSPQEGLAIIEEEMDEAKQAIRHGTGEQAYHEVVQLAAMCLRYLVDIGAQAAIKK